MKLCATPYDTDRPFWYFDSVDMYDKKYSAEYRQHGTEEYEIQLIDGTDAECSIAEVVGLTQGNFAAFCSFMEEDHSIEAYAGAYYLMYNNNTEADEVFEMPVRYLEEAAGHCVGNYPYNEEMAIEAYAEHLLEDSGDLDKVPDFLRGYIDVKSYAHDMRLYGVSAFEFCAKWYVVDN